MSPRHAILFSIAFATFLRGSALLGESPKPPAPARTDHYGDPLPKGARFRLGSVRLRHDGDVTALAWMPDGRTLASAGEDWTIRLWQIPDGKRIAKWENARFVVFSPGGRTLAYTGIFDDAVHCIDISSGKELRKIPLSNGASSVALSRDGKTIATAKWGREGIHLYAVDSGKKHRTLEGKLTSMRQYPDLVFSSDGRDLIGATVDGVCCWNTRTGAKQFPLGKTCFDMFAFSPDGKMLAAVENGIPGAATLRSWPAGKELRRIELKDGGFEALAFSPDGKILATSERGNIRLWDAVTGRQLHRCNERWGSGSLAFSPDGSRLASAGRDGTVNVWELGSGKEPRLLPIAGHQLAFLGVASDGQSLMTRSADNTLTIWDVRNGRRLRTLADGAGSIESFLFGSDACRERALLRQDAESGRYGPAFAKGKICCSAFSPDNTTMAVSGEVGILLLRKTAKGIESRLLDGANRAANAKVKRINIPAIALTFSADGRTLASCCTDGRLFLWDSRTGRPRHVLPLPKHGEPYRSMAFSADGRLLAVSDRHVLYVVETASGQQFWKRPLGEHWIDSFALAPDNRTLAIGDAGSLAAIRLWDLPTNKEIHTLQGHGYSIEKLAFSPDGSILLSSSGDKTVLCWNVAAILRRRASSKELSAAKLSELWTDLASKDAAHAQRAVADLIQVPEAALPFLEKSVPPLTPAQMTRIAALIADLDSEQFTLRERAAEELAKLGDSVVPSLRKVLIEKPSLEMRRRIEALLEPIDARQLSPEGLALRAIRAMQVLETIGTPQARRILEGLAHGAAEALLTLEAKVALQRLNRPDK